WCLARPQCRAGGNRIRLAVEFGSVVIEARAANLDSNARLARERRLRRNQCDNRHIALPARRFGVISGYPQSRIGLAAFDHPRGVEPPSVMLGKAAPKRCAHRKPGHPARRLTTPYALALAPRGSPEKRVFWLRSRSRPCNISIARLSREPPPQTATPKRALFKVSAN